MLNNFLTAFSIVLRQNGLDHNRGPKYYVDSWNEFLESCIEGYLDTLFEYDGDIYFRHEINLLIKSPDLQEFIVDTK